MWDATALLRLYADWRRSRLDGEDGVAVQERMALQLVHAARHTLFGRHHRFDEIRSVADYQARVPIRSYEEFWKDYWSGSFPRLNNVTWPGLVPYFARSSGTTGGTTKHIPVTQPMVRANKRAALELLVHHVSNRPQSRVLAGRNFMLGGSIGLDFPAAGVAEGDLSGIAAATVPWWARGYYFPPPALARLSNWEEKTTRLARESLDADIRSIAGTPSWLLLFFERVQELSQRSNRRLVEFYPDLEMIAHGGVSFAPYRARFAELLAGSHAETREVYPASEGFIAIADRGPEDGLRLLLDNGLFYEFIPVDELGTAMPTRHWLATAEPGVNYALIVSSCAGLWSYVLGDTVRLLDRAPARIAITGRTAYSLSAFGEHLIGEEIDRAVTAAAQAIGASVTDFSVGPIYPADGARKGHHLYIVEFAEPVAAPQLATFSATLDRTLSGLNADYAEHRSGDFGMDPPQIVRVARGAFAAWMKSRGKLGGQNKVPRVVADPQALRTMRDALGATRELGP
ncbi:GH3 auxin-responsive promoter [Enhydrobacter aerosaccus]|uniref:GH3 auxin-responsive promoter n=1 Tax=Enhydrobacter aerosaccus TaxID=225324 RepID=A0A1T4SPZ2_9HYPH|nr:GH3 auxin-responsive promoter family protein [Enhydrobacter aerosaccus]SKA30223.1 GH3 auxin-responsive promoter [Enhydrobacter aerosaccus]